MFTFLSICYFDYKKKKLSIFLDANVATERIMFTVPGSDSLFSVHNG